MRVNLQDFNNSWYEPGRSLVIRGLWFFVNALLFQNPLNPSSYVKICLLKLFGAAVGEGVVIKPNVNIKYPWNLKIGDHSWIGERVWLDSLSLIKIGNNTCVSQGTYLCTGNHDWTDPAFGLIVKSIIINDGAWVGANSTILPGVTIAEHSVISAGSVITQDTEPYMIYWGNPAEIIKERKIK